MNYKNFSSTLERWKPGVQKIVLIINAGTVWIGVGIMLDFLSYNWLKKTDPSTYIPATVVGLLAAVVIHIFGFSRIVKKNLNRIFPMEGKRCFFSFIPWKSYLMIGIMVFMGYSLRHSSIPRYYLASLYIAMGTALILSGINYLKVLRKVEKNDQNQ